MAILKCQKSSGLVDESIHEQLKSEVLRFLKKNKGVFLNLYTKELFIITDEHFPEIKYDGISVKDLSDDNLRGLLLSLQGQLNQIVNKNFFKD